MGRRREHSKDYWEVRKSAERCELCGCSRRLEVHHIIPVALGGPEEKDNMIVVCDRCHMMLTPRSILTKIGIHQAKTRSIVGNFALDFLERVEEQIEDDLDAKDVLDIFNETLHEHMEREGVI